MLSKHNKISFFKVKGTENQYHIVIKVNLKPGNVGNALDQIYRGILPNRSLQFIPHITLGKITTSDITKVIKGLNSYLRKSKLFDPPIKIVIDEVKFEINKKPKSEKYMLKLSRLQPSNNNPSGPVHQYA